MGHVKELMIRPDPLEVIAGEACWETSIEVIHWWDGPDGELLRWPQGVEYGDYYLENGRLKVGLDGLDLVYLGHSIGELLPQSRPTSAPYDYFPDEEGCRIVGRAVNQMTLLYEQLYLDNDDFDDVPPDFNDWIRPWMERDALILIGGTKYPVKYKDSNCG